MRTAAHTQQGRRFVSYEISIEPKSGYLHVIVTGQNTRADVIAYMEAVIRECTLRQCFRVLIEERLEGPRLGTLDVFEIVSTGSARFLRTITAMAYVPYGFFRTSSLLSAGCSRSSRTLSPLARASRQKAGALRRNRAPAARSWSQTRQPPRRSPIPPRL
jgi:hypothetical protein